MTEVWNSLITIFQTVVAGDGWGFLAVPIIEHSMRLRPKSMRISWPGCLCVAMSSPPCVFGQRGVQFSRQQLAKFQDKHVG